jgi:hypothetical protein
MKHSRYTYFLVILVLTILTYEQDLGFNALLIPLCIVGSTYYLLPSIVSEQWLLASALWVLSGLGMALWHLDVGLPLFLITAAHYFAITYQPKISFPTSILQTILSFFTGIIRFFSFKLNFKEPELINESGRQLIRKVLLVIIPLILFIIFLKLYQVANPEFEKLTEFIDLSFVELPFFLYFGLLAVLCYGLFYFKPGQKIMEIDLSADNQILSQDYDDKMHHTATQFEWQIGQIIVTVLSLLLFAFIIVDVQTTFGVGESELNRSQTVHQGINILIGSILLVIVIILYFFRGSLNFKPSYALKHLTSVWLLLNTVLVFLIVVKNSQYIGDWGLTHKRIGVYLYLILCMIGLTFTAYKVYTQWSTSFLIQRVSKTFLSILVVFGLLNWNGMIARYNLNEDNLPAHKIDFHYLARLGPETYVPIIDYLNAHPNGHYKINDILYVQICTLNTGYTEDWTNFLSYTYGGYMAYQTTQHYDFTHCYSMKSF